MATFKACVQKQRKDGFYPVYIRVTHQRATVYIKTDKMVTKRELTSTNEIKDTFVLGFCIKTIQDYQDRLNRQDTRQWTVKQIVDFLTTPEEVMPFSDYARKYIDRLIDNGQEQNRPSVEQELQMIAQQQERENWIMTE